MGKGMKLLGVVVVLLLVGAGNPASAQLTKDENLSRFDDRPLHFGFYLGLNTMDYRFAHYNDLTQNPVVSAQGSSFMADADKKFYNGVHSYRVESYPLKPGFTVGGVINLRMNKGVDFRFTPGMSLGSRQLLFTDNISQYMKSTTNGGILYPGLTYERYTTTPSAYIDIPFGFRYKGFRSGNLRPYIYGGAAYRRDLESKRISESVLHLNRNGYYVEVAFGIDTYFPYFRFTGEFKYSCGLNNLLNFDVSATNPPYYSYVLKSLKSNIFTLIFYFE